MKQAAVSMDVLGFPDNLKILSNVIKTNVAASTSIGPFFTPQLGRIYMDMLGLYRAVSGIISETVARDGPIATKTPKVRLLRTIKKEILKLVETYIAKAEDLESVNDSMVPALFEAILDDYTRNVASARDAEVLNVTTAIVNRLQVSRSLSHRSTSVLTIAIGPPDPANPGRTGCRLRAHSLYDQPRLHRVPRAPKRFLPAPKGRKPTLLRRCGPPILAGLGTSPTYSTCFAALISLPPAQFKMFMDSVVWGIKHTMRDISDVALQRTSFLPSLPSFLDLNSSASVVALDLVNNFAQAETAMMNAFFTQFYMGLIQDIFFVLTDTDHKSGKPQSLVPFRSLKLILRISVGFKLQANLLQRLFQVVEKDTIVAPLFDPAVVNDSTMTNKKYLRGFLGNLFRNAFPHLSP